MADVRYPQGMQKWEQFTPVIEIQSFKFTEYDKRHLKKDGKYSDWNRSIAVRIV